MRWTRNQLREAAAYRKYLWRSEGCIDDDMSAQLMCESLAWLGNDWTAARELVWLLNMVEIRNEDYKRDGEN